VSAGPALLTRTAAPSNVQQSPALGSFTDSAASVRPSVHRMFRQRSTPPRTGRRIFCRASATPAASVCNPGRGRALRDRPCMLAKLNTCGASTTGFWKTVQASKRVVPPTPSACPPPQVRPASARRSQRPHLAHRVGQQDARARIRHLSFRPAPCGGRALDQGFTSLQALRGAGAQ